MIRVQEQPFDIAAEISALKSGHGAIGGTAIFVGSVRDMNDGKNVSALTLEHYPGMTEQSLTDIEEEARQRWPLAASLIVHRFGRMEIGEDIVLVICCSSHREAAFEACAFLMDWLKTKAPFWKLEEGNLGASWVDARYTDEAAAKRWDKS